MVKTQLKPDPKNDADSVACPFPGECGWPRLSYRCRIWWDKSSKWRKAQARSLAATGLKS